MADTVEGAEAPATTQAVRQAADRARQGNLARSGAKLAAQGKLFVRDRLALLLDEGSFVEDGLLANAQAPTGRTGSRPAAPSPTGGPGCRRCGPHLAVRGTARPGR